MTQMIFKTEAEYWAYCKENDLVPYINEESRDEAALEMFDYRYKYRPVIEAKIKGLDEINIAGSRLPVKQAPAPTESEYIL
jgi:hypothetical protein